MLHPAAVAPVASAAFRVRQPAGAATSQPEPLERLACRPLRSVQAEGVDLPTAAAAAPAAARKRERSPRPSQQRDPAVVGAQGRQKRGDAGLPPAALARPPAGPPASKRRRPHVAFGTRCEAPRPRSQRPVKLDAERAHTPPQLPPARPHTAGQGAGAGQAAVEAATQPDLLRLLAATFAGQDSPLPAPFAAGQLEVGDASVIPPGRAVTYQAQQLLSALTAALSDPPRQHSDHAGRSVGGTGGRLTEATPSSSNHNRHASQAVLEAAAGLSARVQPEGGATSGAAPAPPTAIDSCAGALALCDQFDLLLQSSGRELGEARRQLAAATQAEEAVERIQAAAMEAAVAAAEAAVPQHFAGKGREGLRGALPAWEGAVLPVQAEAAATTACVPEERPIADQNSSVRAAAAAIGGSLVGCFGQEPELPAAAHRPDAARQPGQGVQAWPPTVAVPATVASAADQPVVGWPVADKEVSPSALVQGFPIFDLPCAGPVQPAAQPTQAFVTYHGRQATFQLPPQWQPGELKAQPAAAGSDGQPSPSCGSSNSTEERTNPEAVVAEDAAGDEGAPLVGSPALALLEAAAEHAINTCQEVMLQLHAVLARAALPVADLSLNVYACPTLRYLPFPAAAACRS